MKNTWVLFSSTNLVKESKMNYNSTQGIQQTLISPHSLKAKSFPEIIRYIPISILFFFMGNMPHSTYY